MNDKSNHPTQVTIGDVVFDLDYNETGYRTNINGTWYYIQITDGIDAQKYIAYERGKSWIISRGDTLDIIARDLKARHDPAKRASAEAVMAEPATVHPGRSPAKPKVVVTLEFDDEVEVTASLTDVLDLIEQASGITMVANAEIRYPQPVTSVKLW